MPLLKRNIDLNFEGHIPNHWANGDPFITHWLNAYTVLIPDGEHFIIRTCNQYADTVSKELANEIKALYYQEGQHSIQHKKALKVLENQGYKLSWFRGFSSLICYRILEPAFPKITALATASAIENINAIIAEHFLQNKNFFATSSKQMGQMFAWHFAEEIEHKCVVFDLLNNVNNGSLLRLLGLITTFSTFVFFLYLAAFILAWQDRSLFGLHFWRGFYRFNFKEKFLGKIIHGSFIYLKRNFHPTEIDNEYLVDRGINIYQTLRG